MYIRICAIEKTTRVRRFMSGHPDMGVSGDFAKLLTGVFS